MVVVAVGSKNIVKINAARTGTARALKIDPEQVEVEGFDVPSGVADQPIGDEETQQGALNRCQNAFAAYKAKHGVNPDFAVGLEGGVKIAADGELECAAWMVVSDGALVGKARTAAFLLPPLIRDLVLVEKMELAAADDQVFKTVGSKHKGGSVGQFTNGVIDRAAYYEHAIVLAFVPFNYPELYRKQEN